MPDPNLEIRVVGWGDGHPDSEISGGGEDQSPKIFFQPFGPQFGLKIRRAGPSPRFATVNGGRLACDADVI